MAIKKPIPDEVIRLAYEKAWKEFSHFPNLTPDEKIMGPGRLHSYIAATVDAGQRDPAEIASLALGVIRQEEQIARSMARISGTLYRQYLRD